MDGDGITNATTRRPGRTAARIAGATVAALLTVTAAAAPAQAATAGTTYAQLMHRKLDLDTESARLAAQVPGLRTTAATRTAQLAQAQRAQSTAAATLAVATAADQAARSDYATAKAAATAAATAVTAAQHHKPLRLSKVTLAARALRKATTAAETRAATATRTAAALTAARTASSAAAKQLAAGTTAYRTATAAFSTAQQRLATLPKTSAALAAQAAALRAQVVTQTRASFTIAQTTQVYGITVNRVVAYPFQRMIDDAARAGVKLSGGGFRTQAQQISLRKTNGCPDVWTAPSSSCRVPTAIPGRSLHEIGLAVDLTVSKKTISDRRSAAFKWLAANAGRYGFVNLPSEPWHWSLTGN